MSEEIQLKECQLCHQMLPKEQFYKRKDRDGEHNWTMSYCGPCDAIKVNASRAKKPEYYTEYKREHTNKYYHNNKKKVKIIQKRYYYNKLSPEKQVVYKQKIQEKYPEWVDQICV